AWISGSGSGDSTMPSSVTSCRAEDPRDYFEKLCKAFEKHGALCPVFLDDIVDTLFIHYDTDGDGILSREELNELLKDMGYGPLLRKLILDRFLEQMEELNLELRWSIVKSLFEEVCVLWEGEELPPYCQF